MEYQVEIVEENQTQDPCNSCRDARFMSRISRSDLASRVETPCFQLGVLVMVFRLANCEAKWIHGQYNITHYSKILLEDRYLYGWLLM
jgi:hypothetical protein